MTRDETKRRLNRKVNATVRWRVIAGARPIHWSMTFGMGGNFGLDSFYLVLDGIGEPSVCLFGSEWLRCWPCGS